MDWKNKNEKSRKIVCLSCEKRDVSWLLKIAETKQKFGKKSGKFFIDSSLKEFKKKILTWISLQEKNRKNFSQLFQFPFADSPRHTHKSIIFCEWTRFTAWMKPVFIHNECSWDVKVCQLFFMLMSWKFQGKTLFYEPRTFVKLWWIMWDDVWWFNSDTNLYCTKDFPGISTPCSPFNLFSSHF